MSARPYKTPTRVGAVVISIPTNGVEKAHYLTDEATDTNFKDWYPASTIKFVSAILAAKRLSDFGFTSNCSICFKYSGSSQSVTRTFEDLIEKCIVESDNIAYNESVILAGHKYISDILIAGNYKIALNKPYLKSRWRTRTRLIAAGVPLKDFTFVGPEITITEADKDAQNIGKETSSGYRLDTNRSSSASLESLAYFMKDFIEKDSKLKMSDDLYDFVCSKFTKFKGHSQSQQNIDGGQNTFRKELLRGIGDSSSFTIYHKPGYCGVREDGGVYWVDCLYLKNENPELKNYVIAAYGFETYAKLGNKNGRTILSSNYVDDNHCGLSEGIGLLIKRGEI
jgi:hypothetical protein